MGSVHSSTPVTGPMASVKNAGTVKDLRPLIAPRSVAVVGASPKGNRGLTVLENLRAVGFPGEIIAVNPNYREVAGVVCLAQVDDLPAEIDLVVVAVAAEKAVDVIEAAGRRGARAAVVIASGFGDGGSARDLGAELAFTLQRHNMLAVGPNCYGLVDLNTRVAAYSGQLVDPLPSGRVALILQSGALTHSITDSSVGRGLGLSALVTTGNEASLTAADFLAWYADDPNSEVIGIFLEGLRDPDGFARACRHARAVGKPVIVLAAGRSEPGRRAALAHTGSVAGKSSALSGFLASVGAVQVRDIDEFREALILFAAPGRPVCDGAALVSISGGGSSLMADTAQDVHLPLATFQPALAKQLAAALPAFAAVTNPLDVTGAAADEPQILSRALEVLAGSAEVGAVAFAFNVGLGSLGQEDLYRQQARLIAEAAGPSRIPVIAFSLTSGPVDPHIQQRLASAGVPLLSGLRSSLSVLAKWMQWHQSTQPAVQPHAARRPIPGTGTACAGALALTELARAGLDVAPWQVASTPEELAAAAVSLGYPCVVKAESASILHKSELGAVRINLRSEAEVAIAAAEILDAVSVAVPDSINSLLIQRFVPPPHLECLVGAVRDPQVGLVLSVAPGGLLAELFGEAEALPVPLLPHQVDGLLDRSVLGELLSGYRGGPRYDRAALVRSVVAFSKLVAAYGDDLDAAEINPLLVLPSGSGAVAVDCLILPRSR